MTTEKYESKYNLHDQQNIGLAYLLTLLSSLRIHINGIKDMYVK